MILNCDKFFVKELQKNGYAIDYKKIMQVYKKSRNSDGFKKRQSEKEKKISDLQKHINKFYD